MKVALLTNFVPPYRLPLFELIGRGVDELRIYISTPMESNRSWEFERGGLNIICQRCLTFKAKWEQPGSFSESLDLHLPYDTLYHLFSYKPNVIISGEMGFRTLQAALYRLLFPATRLIVWATVSQVTEQNRGKLRNILRTWIAAHADGMFVNGASGAAYVQSIGFPKDKIFKAPYSIDTTIFSGNPTERKEVQYDLLLVNQLIPRKGLSDFFSTLSSWCQTNVKEHIRVGVYGEGPLKKELENLSYPPNLQVTFLGSLPYKDIAHAYKQAKIYAFPTLADEWGIVVNEALASGLPVLGSLNSQAVEELVVPGETGWTYKPDQPDDLYKTLDQALRAPAGELSRMGRNARQIVQGYSHEQVSQQMLGAIYGTSGKTR